MPVLAALTDGRVLVAWSTLLLGSIANEEKVRLRFVECATATSKVRRDLRDAAI